MIYRQGIENVLRCLEVKSSIFRGATIAINKLYAVFLGYSVEVRLVVRRRKAFSKLLPDWRKTVVRLVSRGPKCVSARIIWRRNNFEYGVVRRDSLKGNAFEQFSQSTPSRECYLLGVPSFTTQLLGVEAKSINVVFTVLF